jgi:hypothetical protein
MILALGVGLIPLFFFVTVTDAALTVHVRQAWKGLPGTKAQLYFCFFLLMKKKKKFFNIDHLCQCH